MRAISMLLVPPTLGTRLTRSLGWMQKPVRPTICGGKAEIEQQFGDARDQRDDARLAPATSWRVPSGVDQLRVRW